MGWGYWQSKLNYMWKSCFIPFLQKDGPFPASFSLFSPFLLYNFVGDGVQTAELCCLETDLPTEPQPLPPQPLPTVLLHTLRCAHLVQTTLSHSPGKFIATASQGRRLAGNRKNVSRNRCQVIKNVSTDLSSFLWFRLESRWNEPRLGPEGPGLNLGSHRLRQKPGPAWACFLKARPNFLPRWDQARRP